MTIALSSPRPIGRIPTPFDPPSMNCLTSSAMRWSGLSAASPASCMR